jgi:hypothetical protein
MTVSESVQWSLRISLTLIVWLLLNPCHGSCDTPDATLRTELEDLRVMRSRLLIDFPASPYGVRRLMYVENRRGSYWRGSDRGGSDALLQPEKWALGIDGPLVTAGPVSPRGVLAQLYNPLAHGPGSDVFTDPADLSLDIALDVAGRRGMQLGVIPGHWNLFGLYRETVGVQLGSSVAVPIGPRVEVAFVGLLSSPAGQLEADPDGSWYAGDPAFPGGPISHLAGSLTWDFARLRLHLVAAGSGGQRVAPGALGTLQISWTGSGGELDLLLGHCSGGYFTPEGDIGEVQWMAAARGKRDFGSVHLSAACRKEIGRLPVLPAAFRESRDRLTAGIGISRPLGRGCTLSIEEDASLDLLWSTSGTGGKELSLEGGTTLDWRLWRLELVSEESWNSESGRLGQICLSIAHDPPWGRTRLEAGYQHGGISGFRLSAEIEAIGDGKRIYACLATRDVLPLDTGSKGWQAEDWLQLFTLRVGWEAKSRRQSRR